MEAPRSQVETGRRALGWWRKLRAPEGLLGDCPVLGRGGARLPPGHSSGQDADTPVAKGPGQQEGVGWEPGEQGLQGGVLDTSISGPRA